MPLAHGADRGVAWQCTHAGGRIGFARSDSDYAVLLPDIQRIQPRFFLGMSHFWTDLHADYIHSLHTKAAESLGAMLAVVAGESAARVAKKLPGWSGLIDSWLATRGGGVVQAACLEAARVSLGGEILIAATGGSHTSDEVMTFISRCLVDGNAGRVNNSYGSTEFPGIAQNGVIGAHLELELRPVLAESGSILYSPEDVPYPRGEIAVRGKNGERTLYWGRADLEKESYDSRGDCSRIVVALYCSRTVNPNPAGSYHVICT